MKTSSEIVKIAETCFKELNKKYDKLSNYLVFNHDRTIDQKKEIDSFLAKHHYYKRLMCNILNQHKLSTTVMYYAVGEISKCANCSSLCTLLLPKLHDAGITSLKLVQSMYGIDLNKKNTIRDGRMIFEDRNTLKGNHVDHSFIIVNDNENQPIVIDPYFDLVCPMADYQVNPKVLAFFKIAPNDIFDYSLYLHQTDSFNEVNLKQFKLVLKDQLPIFLKGELSLSMPSTSKNTLFQEPQPKVSINPLDEYKKGNYGVAHDLYAISVKELANQSLKTPTTEIHIKHGIALYNQATCLLQLKEYQKSLTLFESCLALREVYDAGDQSNIEKTKAKIVECKNHLTLELKMFSPK